jgi:O-antigen/teichoic acid export membrane protein
MIATKESSRGAATPLAALLRPRELGAPFYFLAFNLANVFNYLFLIAMAKGLSAEAYGLFGALFGIVYLTSAFGNSVQVTLAKFTAELSSLGEKSRLGALLSTATARIIVLSLLVALVFLAGAPLLAAFLHTSSPIPVLVTGSLVFLALSVPATWGVLQGTQRFYLLGASTFLNSGLRLLFGALLVIAGMGVSGALVGIGLGLLASAAIALGPLRAAASGRSGKEEMGALSAYFWPVVIASIVVAVPTSLDVVLAKHLFAAEQAGVYTAASVLGKVVLFLPLGATFVLFPKVVHRRAQGQETSVLLAAALLITGALSATVTAIFVLAPSSLFATLVGSDLADAGQLLRWYAPAMLLFSFVIVFVYYNLAAGRTAYVSRILLPGVLVQILLWLVGQGSPLMMAQMTLLGCALLLAGSLIYAALPSGTRILTSIASWAGRPAYAGDGARADLSGPAGVSQEG